ncbi:MAG TPA: amino acid ABC transporter substrate-binding protein [Acidimicrobiia bacterium]|nr:amino acid ABC transporter substrate-binding protein [Acidimicrobiia bacterium]
MRRRSLAALVTALALVAACADDGGDDTTTTAGAVEEPTTTAGGVEEPTTTAGGGEAEGDPIVFAASLPLTGEFSISGTKHGDGYQFCVDEINERGGLLGRPVELLIEDNRSDTEVTITQTERFINDGADILLGTFSSLLGFPASTVAFQAGMVMGLPSSAALRIWERGYDNIIYFQQAAAEYTGASVTSLLEYYVEQGVITEPPATAAVVYADDFFAGAIANGFLGRDVTFTNDDGEEVVISLAPGFLDESGIEVVFEQDWPVGFTDWLTLANSIAEADADFVSISTASAEEAISLIQGLQTVGYNPDMVYVSQGNQAEFGEALGSSVNGVITHSVWSPTADFPGTLAGEPYNNADFVEGFTEAFGTPPDEDEAIPFGVCQGMEQAILGTGGTDNAAIIEWLHGRTAEEPVNTVVGSLYWDERGLPVEGSFLVNQWQDEELAFVFPVGEFPGTADLVYPKPEW